MAHMLVMQNQAKPDASSVPAEMQPVTSNEGMSKPTMPISVLEPISMSSNFFDQVVVLTRSTIKLSHWYR